MNIIETEFPGLVVIQPKVFEDARGYFFESYNKSKMGILNTIDFVQDNQSKSSYRTIRGLHYQLEPYAQSKLIRVIDGKILDESTIIDYMISAKNRQLMANTFPLSFPVKKNNSCLFPKDLPMVFLYYPKQQPFCTKQINIIARSLSVE